MDENLGFFNTLCAVLIAFLVGLQVQPVKKEVVPLPATDAPIRNPFDDVAEPPNPFDDVAQPEDIEILKV